jgi:hypothetical protein
MKIRRLKLPISVSPCFSSPVSKLVFSLIKCVFGSAMTKINFSACLVYNEFVGVSVVF